MGFPPVPQEVKAISHFLKVADEHDQRNVTVSYWCRMYAVQSAMKIIPGPKSPEVSQLLMAIMDWLEHAKHEHGDTEGITNETCAQALIEEYAIKLFSYAESQDSQSRFDKNMVKAFYTSGILFDILDQFGNLSEDIEEKRKYAKWRAAYIHNCLKKGIVPTPGSTIILNDKDEYIDFMPKSELDKIKGRTSESEGNEDEGFPDNSPSSSNAPSTPNAWTNQSPLQPLLPEIPSQPVMPPATPPVFPTPNYDTNPNMPLSSSTTAPLTPEQMEKAQKYCKYANSALNYDDVKTAIDNLQKALNLLQFGKDV